MKNLENTLSKLKKNENIFYSYNKAFNLLSNLIKNWDSNDDIKNAIEIGRFDKESFKDL